VRCRSMWEVHHSLCGCCRADDVVARLTSSLPAGFTQDKEQFLRELREAEEQFAPPGTRVDSSTVGEGEDARAFEVYECKLEDNEPAQKLHANLQTTALWFIEGACVEAAECATLND
jgi:hypothetical protein